ncbi:UDP-N-acetylmuramoyl-tripeptide--D-alanyl-D-alanine ligase [Candidatus Protochlamydia phocaeensis]|uniref:UDP-N-acetylmuramoyl-tripeptide--D-alanyl-D- alanine ligase n=1 Tax=Candidatus Protochlamydia phocaeensis TaxID=1414722 RepID=UPI001896794E|nr:UDP-N-acetylmuramoyl-tripeptide--D-alanyl-D-alanine ligase [Candidatus Protochlamydia phocaeensis]
MRSITLGQMARLLQCSDPLPQSLIQGFSTDSRTLKPGEVFIALSGERVDGHAFLADVKQKGCLAAVVSKSYAGPDFGLALLRVEDPLHALQEMAKSALSRSSSRLVAVTGSIGKTTTKEFIKTLLETRYRVAASPGNSNSQVGIPLSILNHTTGEEEILVLEMGMTTPGNLARLVQIAPPEVAVLTRVALVHACNFESLEDIAWAKAEIFSHSHTRLGVIHRDIANYEAIARLGNSHKLSFSTNDPRADYQLDSQDGHKLYAHVENQTIDLGSLLQVPGKHNAHNLLAAIAVARHFNVSWEEIKHAIPFLKLPEKRLQFVDFQGILFLNDSYNASELSVKAALETLPQPKEGGSKVAVLGSMMELGKFSADCHRRVGEFALDHVEQIYCLGEECHPILDVWKKAGKPVELFLDRASLVACLKQALKPADVVLLKGSRSKELWKVLEEL